MRSIGVLISGIIALLSALSVPLFFINSGVIEKYMYQSYPMQVAENYTGGSVYSSFNDPYGDDNGEGTLTYPDNKYWQRMNTLDIIRYVVHKPVTDGKWSSQKVFWQLDITLGALDNPLNAPAGFTHPAIHIYIDIDGQKSGSTTTAEPECEMVQFCKEHPWDYYVDINGFSTTGKLKSAEGKYEKEFPFYLDKKNNTIIARLPLEKDGLLNILDGRATAHYVLVGAYSQLDNGHFMKVQPGNSTTVCGCGAKCMLSPKVYDMLTPESHSQRDMLNSYNVTSCTPATIYPVIANGKEVKSTVTPMVSLEELKAAAEKEVASEPEPESIEDILSGDKSQTDKMVELFKANHIDKAEELAQTILAEDSDNAVVLAYSGSISAIRGGQATSIMDAVGCVQKAYEIFDKAEKLMSTEQELLQLYLNRGNVSLIVPEAVFHKSQLGAEDFEKAGNIYLSMGNEYKPEAGESFYNAGKCLENVDSKIQAEIMFSRAAAIPNLKATTRYELAKMGYIGSN